MPAIERARREILLTARMLRPRFLLVNLACSFMPRFTLSTARTRMYRWAGVRAEKGVSFTDKIAVTGAGPNPLNFLSIGEGTTISTVLFNLEGPITIGKHANVSQYVRIYTAWHAISKDEEKRFSQSFSARPVVIGDGAWVCTGSVLLPGVTVGRGSVVSAGSVVTSDIPPNTLVSGVPAVVVKQLPTKAPADSLSPDAPPAPKTGARGSNRPQAATTAIVRNDQ